MERAGPTLEARWVLPTPGGPCNMTRARLATAVSARVHSLSTCAHFARSSRLLSSGIDVILLSAHLDRDLNSTERCPTHAESLPKPAAWPSWVEARGEGWDQRPRQLSCLVAGPARGECGPCSPGRLGEMA